VVDAAPEDTRGNPLPERAALVIVGSGFCGLSAAREAARRGTNVVVVDQGMLGGGASGRSGGMIGLAPKSLLVEQGRFLRSAVADAKSAFRYLADLIEIENLDVDLQKCGRFFGAFSSAHFEGL
jgi:gamma-glutamylputrescine oxidase